MQKFINNPQDVVDEMIEGYTKAFPHLIAKTNNPRVLKLKDVPIKEKVGIVTGGGSGYKPRGVKKVKYL
jgi:phosphoenolpyruvate---glycerone phosphotransferase subunit DhaK